MNWLLIALTFIGVNLDFFFILLLLLKKYQLRSVILGYLIGVLFIVTLVILLVKSWQFLCPNGY